MKNRILAVDDDPLIRSLVRDYLSENGFEVLLAGNGEEMNRALAQEAVDLVVLDVKLPGEDGFSLARALRSCSKVPIIMLTGQGEEIDRVAGLELGADDYLTKPFSPRELLARIRAVLRRREPAAAAGERVPPPAPRAASQLAQALPSLAPISNPRMLARSLMPPIDWWKNTRASIGAYGEENS